jgi:uncharacterized membrane protein
MIRIKEQVIIQRPADEVFEFIANFENNPVWQSGMVSARFTSPAPMAIGSTYDQAARFLGREVVSSFEVIALEPGRMVKAASTGGSFPITFTRIVEPQGSGTLVRAIVEGDASGFFKLAEPLLRWMVQRSVRGDYANLKRLLENKP